MSRGVLGRNSLPGTNMFWGATYIRGKASKRPTKSGIFEQQGYEKETAGGLGQHGIQILCAPQKHSQIICRQYLKFRFRYNFIAIVVEESESEKSRTGITQFQCNSFAMVIENFETSQPKML